MRRAGQPRFAPKTLQVVPERVSRVPQPRRPPDTNAPCPCPFGCNSGDRPEPISRKLAVWARGGSKSNPQGLRRQTTMGRRDGQGARRFVTFWRPVSLPHRRLSGTRERRMGPHGPQTNLPTAFVRSECERAWLTALWATGHCAGGAIPLPVAIPQVPTHIAHRSDRKEI